MATTARAPADTAAAEGGRACALAVTPAQATLARWSAPISLSLVPISGAVLNDGKLLFWSADVPDNETYAFGGTTSTTLFDPATNTSSDRRFNETELTAPSRTAGSLRRPWHIIVINRNLRTGHNRHPGAFDTIMTTAKRAAKRAPVKRGQGRPVAGENDVGQERLLTATHKLLREMPPARVTIARIAQEANADPALVRYYFGNRTALLLAVADRITEKAQHTAEISSAPDVVLAEHIRRTVRFTRSAPFMHRLMIEELADAGTDESRARVREMNLGLVAFYRRVLEADGGRTMQSVNPLFLHLLVLGTGDFFATAEPLIRELVPSHTNMEKLAANFQEFLVKLVLDGLRKA